jgi:hypothetical protein
LQSGSTWEQVQEWICGSPEYFQKRGGGTNDGFLTALYQDALGRAVDATARAIFDRDLANGMSRTQVADAIFGSDEYRRDLVQSFYRSFLRRPADPQGLDAFAALLSQGARDETIIGYIMASPEYFARP